MKKFKLGYVHDRQIWKWYCGVSEYDWTWRFVQDVESGVYQSSSMPKPIVDCLIWIYCVKNDNLIEHFHIEEVSDAG